MRHEKALYHKLSEQNLTLKPPTAKIVENKHYTSRGYSLSKKKRK